MLGHHACFATSGSLGSVSQTTPPPCRTGLALGGGFTTSIARASVLKVLEGKNIPMNCAPGVSAGSVAAAGFSSGATRNPRLRSLPDRLRQIALYEIGGLGLISPVFALATGISPTNSLGLLAALALIVGTWNGLYSTVFDWAEAAMTGRSADHRPPLLRVAHAVMLEAGAVVATTPVIACWTNVSCEAALLEDVGLTLAYSAYAFVFGLVYDSLFPIDSERWMVEVING